MAATVVDSGTVRRSGVVSLAPADVYSIDGAILANCSGFISVTGQGTSGDVYGGNGSWYKAASLQGWLPSDYGTATGERSTVNGNAITLFATGGGAGKLEIAFVGGQLKITNNFAAVETIVVAYDVTIITH